MHLYTIETYGELRPHLEQEWLLTNGIGSFASSTVVGCNTRRYHGLLCAATQPPVGRMMLLNRIGEIIKLDDDATLHELSVNIFRNAIHPRGDRLLQAFELGDTARWTFDVEGVRVVKEVQLLWQRNITAIRYTIEPGAKQVELDLLPFVSLRDFHALRQKNGGNFDVRPGFEHVAVRDGNHSLWMRSDAAQFDFQPDWWLGHVYPIETERGQDDSEDLFKPGMFVFKTSKPATVTLWASIDDVAIIDWDAELARRSQHLAAERSSAPSPTTQRLIHAANDFIVARKSPDGSAGVTILAGYPWFADWGRDTMISLPGLLLSTNRFKEAAQVLSLFARYVSQGMIPNRFDDYSNEPSYNTVDASLWFIHACFEYLRVSNDEKTFNESLLPACRAIIKGYSQGTRYNIKMDPADGLITQGDPSTQLTWMDAKIGDHAFTPRQGKPVEINALWYNALVLMGETELAAKVKQNFVNQFWINPFKGLCDVLSGTMRDMSCRPNQIFAVSLPHSALSREQQQAVVETVRRELLTPVGLRTLSPSDPKFRSRYTGPQTQRDEAYHNGTIWPWLIGAFLEAYLKVNNNSPAAAEQARQWLAPLIDHMKDNGSIGSISEIFEAEPPHRPVGCFAQAWSVAEVLRLAQRLDL